MHLPIPDADRIAHFDAVFVDWIGGQDVYHMLIAHSCGNTIRDIAEMYGVPRATVHTWIVKAKMKMRRVGLDVSALDQHTPTLTKDHV